MDDSVGENFGLGEGVGEDGFEVGRDRLGV